MQNYHVQMTDEALEDMNAILEYISTTLSSPETAKKQYRRIADGILSLDTFPERYPILQLKSLLLRGLRRMPVDHYSIFYVIEGKNVIVTNVLYSSVDIIRRLQ